MDTRLDETSRDSADEAARYRRETYVPDARGDHHRKAQEARDGVTTRPKSPTPRKPKDKRSAVVIAGSIAAVVLIGVIAAFAYMGTISGNLHAGVDQDLREALVHTDMANEPFYVLLLGTDQSALRDELGEMDGVYRSDSMMLARIDPVQKKVALVSIPRDTMIELGEYGTQKINAARAFGGPALAVQAVSDLAGVDIAHYAEINFDGFQAIVDSLGGIEVEVPIEMDDPDAGGYLPAGLQMLDGEKALILCRARASYADVAADPDSMRTANQRMVLSAIAHKLLSSDVVTIANSVSAVSEYVTTDLELNDIIGIAQTMKDLDPASDIYTATMPGTSEYVLASPTVDEGSYEILDEEKWARMIERMDNGLPPSESAIVDEKTGTVLATAGADAVDTTTKDATVDVKNGTEHTRLGEQVDGLLKAAGFVNTTVGDAAPQYEYPETLVIYDSTAQAYEANLIVSALGQGKAKLNDGTYVYDTDFMVVIGDDWKTDESASSSTQASPPAAQ